MHVLDLFAETSLEEEAAFLAKQSMKEAAGVGVVKGGKDPRYMTATMGNQNDVTGSTLGKEMKAYFPTKPPKIQHQKQIKNSVAETADVTDYNPPSQGGTRQELVAKYHQTKDPKDAEAARRAGATQQELQGVAEGLGAYDNDKGIKHTRGSLLAKLEALPKGSDDFEWNRNRAIQHLKQGDTLRAKYYMMLMKRGEQGVAEQQAGNAAFSPEEIAAINQYLDDEISFIQLRRGYPGVISKAAQQFGIGPVRGFVGEIGFYDRMLQARDEGDIPKQGVAEGDKQTPGIALSKAYEKDFTGKYPGGTLPAATKGKTPGIALSKAYKKDFTGKYPGGELEEGFGRYNITIPSNLLRKIQKIFPKDSVRDIGEWYASAEEYGQPLTVKEYANWRKQGVAEGEYDHSELYNGCYVRDEQDGANGEVFRMSGDPEDRRVRIEDKDGRGWYISPHRLQLVDENDPAVARWFGNSRDEDDLAEGDNLATFVGPNEDSTDVMDHRGAVTDSFTEDLARIKTLALSK